MVKKIVYVYNCKGQFMYISKVLIYILHLSCEEIEEQFIDGVRKKKNIKSSVKKTQHFDKHTESVPEEFNFVLNLLNADFSCIQHYFYHFPF